MIRRIQWHKGCIWAPWSRPEHRSTHVHSCRALSQKDRDQGTVSRADETKLFPYCEPFNIAGSHLTASELIELLAPLASDTRVHKIREVAANRTFDVVPVVEGLYDLGNVAAVCRSADALGYGGIHVIDSLSERYKQSARTSRGAEKWLDVRVWKDTTSCIRHLKGQGRQVLVTHLDERAIPITEVDWTRPTAIILGNEAEGVSDQAVKEADGSVIIPMSGFVQSFNVSVAAAIVLHEAREARIRKQGHHGTLSEEQQRILSAVMLLRSQRRFKTYLSEVLHRDAPKWQQGRIAAYERRLKQHIDDGVTSLDSTVSGELVVCNARL